MQTYSLRTESDIVKDEGENRFSRDEDILVSGSGVVKIGTVLGKVTSSGKFAPLTPGASNGTQTAAAIILETADATSADRTVVTLKRRAQVVLQNLVWPEGISPTVKANAIAALETQGIVARNGV
jgi:hypothetical protein